MNIKHKNIILKRAPNLFLLMLKAALKRPHKNISTEHVPNMDETMLVLQNVRVPLEKVGKFNQLVAWQGSPEVLHPCFLHTLLFPLHLRLLVDENFPFSLVGLVHIHNEIHQIRPVFVEEELDLSCYLTDVEAHPKGWMFSVCSQAHSGGSLVCESKSTNLFRLTQIQTQKVSSINIETPTSIPFKRSQNWQLRADLGRKYAHSSGDYNLIHLYALLAKLFGFKRQIAHGMWTKARSLSALQQLEPNPFEQEFLVKVKFIKAIFLPTNVEFCCSKIDSTEKALSFTVTSPNPISNETIQHLQGNLS